MLLICRRATCDIAVVNDLRCFLLPAAFMSTFSSYVGVISQAVPAAIFAGTWAAYENQAS